METLVYPGCPGESALHDEEAPPLRNAAEFVRATIRERSPEPATRSLTVDETITSPGPAVSITRAAMFTPIPVPSSPRSSTSPVWSPARISTPSDLTLPAIAWAQRMRGPDRQTSPGRRRRWSSRDVHDAAAVLDGSRCRADPEGPSTAVPELAFIRAKMELDAESRWRRARTAARCATRRTSAGPRARRRASRQGPSLAARAAPQLHRWARVHGRLLCRSKRGLRASAGEPSHLLRRQRSMHRRRLCRLSSVVRLRALADLSVS
jgi:hypothetical protein